MRSEEDIEGVESGLDGVGGLSIMERVEVVTTCKLHGNV